MPKKSPNLVKNPHCKLEKNKKGYKNELDKWKKMRGNQSKCIQSNKEQQWWNTKEIDIDHGYRTDLHNQRSICDS